MNNTIGWIGSILFCLCSLPQVIKAFKTKSTNDLSWSFLLMWLGGEILSIIYIRDIAFTILPILINYIINLILLILLITLKFKYDSKKIN